MLQEVKKLIHEMRSSGTNVLNDMDNNGASIPVTPPPLPPPIFFDIAPLAVEVNIKEEKTVLH